MNKLSLKDFVIVFWRTQRVKTIGTSLSLFRQVVFSRLDGKGRVMLRLGVKTIIYLNIFLPPNEEEKWLILNLGSFRQAVFQALPNRPEKTPFVSVSVTISLAFRQTKKKWKCFFFSSSAGKAREVWIRLILHCFNVILFYAKMLFVISLINYFCMNQRFFINTNSSSILTLFSRSFSSVVTYIHTYQPDHQY